MELTLLLWALSVIGGGGLGAIITYICTFKSKKKLAKVGADTAEVDMEHKKLELYHDLYIYLQETCDRYIKEYHELENNFRNQITDIRSLLDAITIEKSQAISAKCAEIADLKAKITYLNGIRCYNFTCPNRVKENPDKKA